MDRITKILLAAIAVGLFANALRPAAAQVDNPQAVIAQTIQEIADGRCANRALCPGRFGTPGGFGSP